MEETGFILANCFCGAPHSSIITLNFFLLLYLFRAISHLLSPQAWKPARFFSTFKSTFLEFHNFGSTGQTSGRAIGDYLKVIWCSDTQVRYWGIQVRAPRFKSRATDLFSLTLYLGISWHLWTDHRALCMYLTWLAATPTSVSFIFVFIPSRYANKLCKFDSVFPSLGYSVSTSSW